MRRLMCAAVWLLSRDMFEQVVLPANVNDIPSMVTQAISLYGAIQGGRGASSTGGSSRDELDAQPARSLYDPDLSDAPPVAGRGSSSSSSGVESSDSGDVREFKLAPFPGPSTSSSS